MAIWMDMTNSMHVWQGGVVGIVRAELEIAKNMHRADPDVRFCKFDGSGIVELPAGSLSWLWESDSVGDAYLTAMGRSQESGPAREDDLRERYPGLDNAYRFSSSRLLRLEWGLLLYCNTLPGWLGRCLKAVISTLFRPLKWISMRRALRKGAKQQAQPKAAPRKPAHPFQEGDTVFSCGWMHSGKEEAFELVKQKLQNIALIYLIYDVILLRENTKQFYGLSEVDDFRRYLHWASMHCDALLFGGETAMEDTAAYQKAHELPVLPGYPVRFGSDILRDSLDSSEVEAYREQIGLTGDFIMAVGSLDDRKNYSTLYRAMTILGERHPEMELQLVIVGKGGACLDLRDTMEIDPRTKDRIILTAPTDQELDWLYQNAKFVVLASAWEGWSLTLPEALRYHKLVIASDVAPLREVAGDLAVYADTFDPFDWAEKIAYYDNNDGERERYEQRLEKDYRPISWEDCGQQVSEILHRLDAETVCEQNTLYMDITLAWFTALMGGKIAGILKTELMLIRALYRKYPSIKFFALHEAWGYQPIDVSALAELVTGTDLDKDFDRCRAALSRIRSIPAWNESDPAQSAAAQKALDGLKCKTDAYWFLVSLFPQPRQQRMIDYGKKKKAKLQAEIGLKDADTAVVDPPQDVYEVPFKPGDVVFTAGTASGERSYRKLLRTREKIGYKYCPIIYDYTPVLLPQVHQKETCKMYGPFLEFNSEMADLIFYGGETARNDGIRYQEEHGQRVPPSKAIRFGSDIVRETKRYDQDEIEERLKEMGVEGPFIMAVGTLEARKNHETLYRAYLRLLDAHEEDELPQLLFCGHPGWKTGDFLATLGRDERVKGKILLLSPTDEQLDILYRECEFTVLASLYEGWSLTLPESLWYGKFCLCCDTPALRETAGGLSEYVHPWDEKRWSERIYHYHTHPQELARREETIRRDWHPISWDECADDILATLKEELSAPGGRSENRKEGSECQIGS